MKIALFSTDDGGGAGRAALRLHKGLTQLGHDSSFFSRWKTAGSIEAVQLTSPEIANRWIDKAVGEKIQQELRAGNTMCSAMYPSVGFEFLDIIRDYDIVNLHWIAMFLSVEAITHIRRMGKPIVWTLHDQNPMTGVCHYTHGCNKYETVCTGCPQMEQDIHELVRTFFEAKLKYIPQDIVIVSPSRWLADCARKSAIFRNHRIEVIANSLETDIFAPHDKKDAKLRLGLPENAKVVLFGATTAAERRKGFLELIKATDIMMHDARLKELIAQERVHVLTFGHLSDDMADLGLPLTSLGNVEDDQRLVLAYSAADVLVLPSLEDNLPNIMLESLACGTPIVAFNTGGMPDVIRNGENGYLVPLGDLYSLADKIIAVLTGKQMSNSCRRQAEELFRLEDQAQKYVELFSQLTAKGERLFKSTPVPIVFPEVAQALGQPLINAAVEVQKEYDELASYLNNTITQNSELVQKHEQLTKEYNIIITQNGDLVQKQEQLTKEYEILIQHTDQLLELNKGLSHQGKKAAEINCELTKHRERLVEENRLLCQERDRMIIEREFLLQEKSQQADEIAMLSEDRSRYIMKLGSLVLKLHRIYLSRSWRITRPLRYLEGRIKQLCSRR